MKFLGAYERDPDWLKSIRFVFDKFEPTIDSGTVSRLLVLFFAFALCFAEAQDQPVDFEKKLSDAQEELIDLQQRLEAPVSKTEIIDPDTVTEAKRLSLSAEISSAQDVASGLISEEKDRSSRLATLPSEIAQLRQNLEEAEGDSSEEIQSNLAAAERELRFLTESTAWFASRKDLSARRLSRLTEELATVADALGKTEANEARQAITQIKNVQESLSAESSELRDYAAENVALAQQRVGSTGLVREISNEIHALADSEAQLRQIEEQFSGATRRISLLESAGLTIDEETGEMLRSQRSQLPSLADMKRKLVSGIRRAATVQLERVKAEDERRALTVDFEGAVATLDPDRSEVAAQLVRTRQKLLDDAISDYSTLQTALESSNEVITQKISRTAEFKTYLNTQLLWLRSSNPIGVNDFAAEARGTVELFIGAPAVNWSGKLLDDLRDQPAIWLLGLLIASYLFWRRRTFKQHYIDAAQGAKSNTEYKPTLIALYYALVRCAVVIFPIWFIIWRTDGSIFSIGKGLVAAAIALTTFLIIHELSRVPHGLLVTHLGKTGTLAERLRDMSFRLSWTFVPLIFFAVALSAVHPTGEGRIYFVGALTIAALQAHFLLKPSVGILSHLGFRSTYARAFYGFCVFGLIAMIFATLLGYFTSARIVSEKMASTLGILFLAALSAALLLRWVQVSRKKVAQRAENERRKAAQREANQGPFEGPAEIAEAEQQRSAEEYAARKAKLSQNQEETQRLVRIIAVLTAGFAIWGVWSSSLPALSALDKVNIWAASGATTSTTSSSSLSDSTGLPNILPSETGETPEAEPDSDAVVSRNVTLQDVILAIFILLLVVFASRHLPATLDLLVLQKLSLEPGSAFAITTTVRYTVVGIGIAMVFSRLGIQWENIQWIAAAVTVGIGFGLQEIFANFVAGLIILFERPIRLGDFVTLSDVSGQVSKIRIRATTIRDFSNKELVVPNKEFITGQLINWTLTDPVMRLEIPVGIAYGSDTALATSELERIARDTEHVMETPKPSVAFMNFGESSLDFDLRVFIRGAENIVPVQSKIRYAIDAAFREAGIEIAFPQRDLHIRSLPEKMTQNQLEAVLKGGAIDGRKES